MIKDNWKMIIKSHVSSLEITASLIYLASNTTHATRIPHLWKFAITRVTMKRQKAWRLCILAKKEKNCSSCFDQIRLAGLDAHYLYRTYTVTYTYDLCTRNDPLRVHACLHTAIGSFRYRIPLIRPRTKNLPVIIPPRLIAIPAIYIHFCSCSFIWSSSQEEALILLRSMLSALFLSRNSWFADRPWFQLVTIFVVESFVYQS